MLRRLQIWILKAEHCLWKAGRIMLILVFCFVWRGWLISHFYIEGLTLAIFILTKVIVSCGTIKIHIDMLSVLLHTTKEPNIVFQNCRQDLMLSYPVFLLTCSTPACSPIVPVAWAEFLVSFQILLSYAFQLSNICDALRDSVPFVQFNKGEKHQWRSLLLVSLQLY